MVCTCWQRGYTKACAYGFMSVVNTGSMHMCILRFVCGVLVGSRGLRQKLGFRVHVRVGESASACIVCIIAHQNGFSLIRTGTANALENQGTTYPVTCLDHIRVLYILTNRNDVGKYDL